MHAIEEVEEPTTRPDDTPERKRKANPSYTEEEVS
jgi:hypothetical protein